MGDKRNFKRKHLSRVTFWIQQRRQRSQSYLFQLVPSSNSRYLTRNWTETFVTLEVMVFFKSTILNFIHPKRNSIYNCHNPKGFRLITRLHLGLSHLCKHKFKHSFQDCLNPFCLCRSDIEKPSHFLLQCPTYSN